MTCHNKKDCVTVIRALLERNSHPNKALHGDDENIDAYLAAQALLASNDREGRKQATSWIENSLKEPSELGRWEMATELVGKYHLSQLKAYLSAKEIRGDQKVTAAAALAKLGDMPAQQHLREKITNPRFFYFVVRDLELIKLLGLSRKEIENAVSPERRAEFVKNIPDPTDKDTHWDMAETAAARACAYLGHPERLRHLAGQLRELSRANTERSRGKLLMILPAIEDVGDKSMIPVLEAFVAAAPDDEQKLQASLAIVKILQREKAESATATSSSAKPSP